MSDARVLIEGGELQEARMHDRAGSPEPAVVRLACPRAREQLLVCLLAATDVYVWKLLRRDFGLGRKASEAAVERLICGVFVNVKAGK